MSNIINYNYPVSKVVLFKEKTRHGTRYGVEYTLGRDRVPDSVLFKYNAVCDTIAFMEYHYSYFGKYPDVKKIAFSKGREHSIILDGASLTVAQKVAGMIASILKTEATCTFMQFIPPQLANCY